MGTPQLDVVKPEAEQRAQLVSDETAARSSMTQFVVDAAARCVGGRPEVLARAINLFIADRLRKQANRDAIARLAVQQLQHNPPREPPANEPDDDWLGVFEQYAEHASSQRLRETWASVLVGEIRKPGAFALRTLQFIATMDRTLANDVKAVAGCLFDGAFLPLLGPFAGEQLGLVLRLTQAGFFLFGTGRRYALPEEGNLGVRIGKGLVAEFAGKIPDQTLNVHGANVTFLGKEVLSVISAEDDLPTAETLARAVAERYGLSVTMHCDL
jgi:hypothetical protein